MLDTATAVADVGEAQLRWQHDSWLNTLVEGSDRLEPAATALTLRLHAGVWLPSTQAIPTSFGRDYASFQGSGSVSYVANGWNLTATTIYGDGQ